MTVEALKSALPAYEKYKEAERLLIILHSPVTGFETNGCSVSIPPELAEPVRASMAAAIQQECDRLQAELEAL